MKIGITGFSGFIGSNIYHYFQNLKVVVVPIDLRSIDANNIKDDLSNLDWVLHFASKTNIPNTNHEVDEIYSNNIVSTSKAIRIARMTNASFLMLSSYVYGEPNYLPVDENHTIKPINSYINSKLIEEKLCEDQLSNREKSLVILRCFNIYGFGLKVGKLIHDVMISAINGKHILINDPNPKRDYLYIDDFCKLIKKIIFFKKPIKQTFNVGSGESYSNIRIAEIVRDLVKTSKDIKISNNFRENDVLRIEADISSISKTYGWYPQINIYDGLKMTFNKFLKNN